MSASQEITEIQGRGIVVRGSDIDTDRIIPARFLRLLTFDDLGPHVFEDERIAQEGRHPFDDPRFQGANVLVVNSNFGSGSSREHAPQALRRWGIEAILGESFAEIFFGNCVCVGLPCLTLHADDIASLQNTVQNDHSTLLNIDMASVRIGLGDNHLQGNIPAAARKSFLTGDNPAEVRDTGARLSYLTGFATRS